MKAERKNDPPAQQEERKPIPSISNERFVEIEDRMANALTSEEIQRRSSKLISEIREAVSSTPRNLQTAKMLSLELKQLNRLSNFRNQQLKNELQSLQNNADAVYLSFNNLANEISHMKKSIVAFLDFRSSDADLELVPIEEFFEKGAKEIGFDMNQKDDEHHLRIGQLNFELAQRNAMSDSIREKEDLKSLLTSDIKGKSNRLNQIRPMISKVKDSARPLLEILNLKRVGDVAPESRRKTQFLPNELKLLSLYCGAYNELFPEEALACGCEGDAQAVEKFENRKKREPTEERGEMVKEENGEGDEEGPSSKRPRIAALNKDDKKNYQQIRLESHPIALTLAIPCGELLTNLHFYYVPDLKCVTVKSSVKGKISCSELFSSDHLLDDLLEEGDSGEECPNEVVTVLLKHADIDLAEHLATIGKPYRFAQLMSIGGFASTESQFERFRAFVSAARQRILDRQNLGNTLNPLSSAHDRIFPAFVKRFESKHPVKMSGVKTIFNPMFKLEEDEEAKEQPARYFLFQCNVDHSSLSLNVTVHIPYSYPRQKPIFMLSSKHPVESESLSNALKEFENAINEKDLNQNNEEGKFNLFATQMAVLVRRLPIVFQIESEGGERTVGDLLFDE